MALGSAIAVPTVRAPRTLVASIVLIFIISAVNGDVTLPSEEPLIKALSASRKSLPAFAALANSLPFSRVLIKAGSLAMRLVETNKVFSEKLKMVKINSELIELFMATLKRRLKSNRNDNKSDIEKVVKEIDKNKTRLKNAQILMLDGELNSLEYKEMKIKIEEDLVRLAIDENKLRSNTTSHDKLIDTCTKVVRNLDVAYEKADATTKQRIIGSIFPKKFQFVNNQARTASINELINQICRQNQGFQGK